jgi:hypothetical protein
MQPAVEYRIKPDRRPWGDPFYCWFPALGHNGQWLCLCYVQTREVEGRNLGGCSWLGYEWRRVP